MNTRQDEAPLNQRLYDLVRWSRMELHRANLISDEEYVELAQDHSAVKRLENYDASVAALRAENQKLRGVCGEAYQLVLTTSDLDHELVCVMARERAEAAPVARPTRTAYGKE